MVYIDVILIGSKTYEEHINHLKKFAEICKRNGIILSQKKAETRFESIDIRLVNLEIMVNTIETEIKNKTKL